MHGPLQQVKRSCSDEGLATSAPVMLHTTDLADTPARSGQALPALAALPAWHPQHNPCFVPSCSPPASSLSPSTPLSPAPRYASAAAPWLGPACRIWSKKHHLTPAHAHPGLPRDQPAKKRSNQMKSRGRAHLERLRSSRSSLHGKAGLALRSLAEGSQQGGRILLSNRRGDLELAPHPGLQPLQGEEARCGGVLLAPRGLQQLCNLHNGKANEITPVPASKASEPSMGSADVFGTQRGSAAGLPMKAGQTLSWGVSRDPFWAWELIWDEHADRLECLHSCQDTAAMKPSLHSVHPLTGPGSLGK